MTKKKAESLVVGELGNFVVSRDPMDDIHLSIGVDLATMEQPVIKRDFSDYKFRCSSLPTLMVQSRSKDPLSETTKSYLRELWIKEVYGREKYDTKNKYTDKGIACESDTFDLIEQVTGKVYFKNPTRFENEWVCGTPDIVDEDMIIDAKSSWDIWTFSAVTEHSAHKDYYYQLIGYMWLKHKLKARLAYGLVNTPDEIMNAEMLRISYKVPQIGTDDEFDKKVMKNYKFDDIDPKLRLKIFDFDFDLNEVEELKFKIEKCREYMNGLSL